MLPLCNRRVEMNPTFDVPTLCAVQNKGLPEKNDFIGLWRFRQRKRPFTLQPQTKTLNTWKISLPFVSAFPFAMLLWPRNFAIDISTLQREREEPAGVSRIFGEDCSHCVVPCQNADVMHNLSTSYGAWNLSSISSPPEGSWISVIRMYCSHMKWSCTDFSYNPRCILLIGCGVYISVTLLPSAACSRVYNQGWRLIE